MTDQDERDLRPYLIMGIESDYGVPSEMHLWIVGYEDYLDEMEHKILNPLKKVVDEGSFS